MATDSQMSRTFDHHYTKLVDTNNTFAELHTPSETSHTSIVAQHHATLANDPMAIECRNHLCMQTSCVLTLVSRLVAASLRNLALTHIHPTLLLFALCVPQSLPSVQSRWLRRYLWDTWSSPDNTWSSNKCHWCVQTPSYSTATCSHYMFSAITIWSQYETLEITGPYFCAIE